MGGVIGISGGIDSSVTMVLAAKALGPENVLGIMLPEKDSSGDSAIFAQRLADKFGVKAITEDITGALQGFGCYERRDEAVKKVFPQYDPAHHKMKIGIKNAGLFTNLPPLFSVTIVDSNGNEQSKRLPPAEFSRSKLHQISNSAAGCQCFTIMPNAFTMQSSGHPINMKLNRDFLLKTEMGVQMLCL